MLGRGQEPVLNSGWRVSQNKWAHHTEVGSLPDFCPGLDLGIQHSLRSEGPGSKSQHSPFPVL